MYGKNGELLRDLRDVEDDAIRRVSIMNHEHEKDSSDGSPPDDNKY